MESEITSSVNSTLQHPREHKKLLTLNNQRWFGITRNRITKSIVAWLNSWSSTNSLYEYVLKPKRTIIDLWRHWSDIRMLQVICMKIQGLIGFHPWTFWDGNSTPTSAWGWKLGNTTTHNKFRLIHNSEWAGGKQYIIEHALFRLWIPWHPFAEKHLITFPFFSFRKLRFSWDDNGWTTTKDQGRRKTCLSVCRGRHMPCG